MEFPRARAQIRSQGNRASCPLAAAAGHACVFRGLSGMRFYAAAITAGSNPKHFVFFFFVFSPRCWQQQHSAMLAATLPLFPPLSSLM